MDKQHFKQVEKIIVNPLANEYFNENWMLSYLDSGFCINSKMIFTNFPTHV